MATILVIDDEPTVAELLADLLGDEGHTVALAYGGAEGLERARALRPDLIISDIMMPGLDGREVARAVRADGSLAHTCIILMTAGPARPGPDDQTDGFIAKPFLLDQVLAVVERLLARPSRARGR